MKNKNNFYIGNIKKDSLTNSSVKGWVVGSFMPEESIFHMDEVEIKYWELRVGKTTHPTKISSIVEVTIILKGKMRGMFDNKIKTLSAEEYFIIKPGTINNFPQEVIEEGVGITIKAPSDTSAKKIVNI